MLQHVEVFNEIRAFEVGSTTRIMRGVRGSGTEYGQASVREKRRPKYWASLDGRSVSQFDGRIEATAKAVEDAYLIVWGSAGSTGVKSYELSGRRIFQ
jgi:hypothetical protein